MHRSQCMFTTLCLPLWSLKSSPIYYAASVCSFSAGTDALLLYFSTISSPKEDHTPWYHQIQAVWAFHFPKPCTSILSLSILLFCCHQLSLPTLPWMLAMFPSTLLAPPHACKWLFESIYNQKRTTMFHRNLAPQKRGIQFRWHQM